MPRPSDGREVANAASMVPGAVLGAWEARRLWRRGNWSALAPLSYAGASVVSMVYHASVHARGRRASAAWLRADLVAQQVTCVLTVAHTPLGAGGVAFALASALVSATLDVRQTRPAMAAFFINGACIVVCSGVVPWHVYALWAVTFALFAVGCVRSNPWTHVAFHLVADGALHEVWTRMRKN